MFTACPADRCSSGTKARRPAQSRRGGLTDLHRYLVIILAGQEVTIDITFPADQDLGQAPVDVPGLRPGP